METVAQQYLPNGTILTFANGNDPYVKTLNGITCHCYIAPLMNALYQINQNPNALHYLNLIGLPTDIAVGKYIVVGEITFCRCKKKWCNNCPNLWNRFLCAFLNFDYTYPLKYTYRKNFFYITNYLSINSLLLHLLNKYCISIKLLVGRELVKRYQS